MEDQEELHLQNYKTLEMLGILLKIGEEEMLGEILYLLLIKEILIGLGTIIPDIIDMEIDNLEVMEDIIPIIRDSQIDLEEIEEEEEDFKNNEINLY